MINVTNMDNGGSDNSDTFAGYLTYGANNPSPEVHAATSPGHQVLTSSAATNLSAQQVSLAIFFYTSRDYNADP